MPILGDRLSSINEDASNPWDELSRCSISARGGGFLGISSRNRTGQSRSIVIFSS
jgi:hypothetical protein